MDDWLNWLWVFAIPAGLLGWWFIKRREHKQLIEAGKLAREKARVLNGKMLRVVSVEPREGSSTVAVLAPMDRDRPRITYVVDGPVVLPGHFFKVFFKEDLAVWERGDWLGHPSPRYRTMARDYLTFLPTGNP